MTSVAEKIIAVLRFSDGLPDRLVAQRAFGKGANAARAHNECVYMVQQGLIERRTRDDGLIGNYLTEKGRRHGQA
jgi:hypothetical protein